MDKFPKGEKNNALWWLIAVVLFLSGAFWWAGLLIFFLNSRGKLPAISDLLAWLKNCFGETEKTASYAAEKETHQHKTTQTKSEGKKEHAKKIGNGTFLTVFGVLLSAAGGIALTVAGVNALTRVFGKAFFSSMGVGVPLFLSGILLLLTGASRRSRSRRFSALKQMLGDGIQMSIQSIADMAGHSYSVTLRDLQQMCALGYFPGAWVDKASGRLMIRPYQEEAPKESQTETEQILRRIRADNEIIQDSEISEKLDQIEKLTGQILSYPQQKGENRSFMHYYLPQTLKLVETYARLEASGVDTENVRETKKKISDGLDKLLLGFERHLNALYASEVIDISSDIAVMEQMLAKDGLTDDLFGGDGYVF